MKIETGPQELARLRAERAELAQDAESSGNRRAINAWDRKHTARLHELAARYPSADPGHTPTPWRRNGAALEVGIGRNATVLALCSSTEADAAFMLRAVNGYERLVKAAADVLSAFGGDIPDWLRNEADELHRAVDAAREEK